jgi:hypothetical protein
VDTQAQTVQDRPLLRWRAQTVFAHRTGLFNKDNAMRILITGGPVHAYLDAVKIITNRFRGGLMAELAEQFCDRNRGAYVGDPAAVEIVYLTARNQKEPQPLGRNLTIVHHDGLFDYRDKVLELAPTMDAVILGAAVANLIPAEPIKGKFPSHNYKVGDIIPINFTIAPRIIDMVKEVAPKTHLFGFKLLAGVSHDELVHAAYETLLWSKATAVFANQTDDLTQKYIVTKERGVHPMHKDGIVEFVMDCVRDGYYHTNHESSYPYADADSYVSASMNTGYGNTMRRFIDHFRAEFPTSPEGYVFGTVAVRWWGGQFKSMLTTARGKNELDEFTTVVGIDHDNRCVNVIGNKATLNAPLLDHLFRTTEANVIVHLHKQIDGLPTLPYAPPGTVRDSIREVKGSFNIAGHGCFLLFKGTDPMSEYMV